MSRKKGLMVVFEGTDGSGKTTIIENLPRFLNGNFMAEDIVYYHWRPGYIKSPRKQSNENVGTVCTNPHGKKSYGKIVSLAKFMYFNLDYIFGYWLEVRKHIDTGKLVVFDRYYYDYYLDKQRYRMDISDMFLDLCKSMIPKPDITFALVGDPVVLYERKKEISIEEIRRQIENVCVYKDRFSNCIVVDVNQEIDAVVQTVCDVMTNYDA